MLVVVAVVRLAQEEELAVLHGLRATARGRRWAVGLDVEEEREAGLVVIVLVELARDVDDAAGFPDAGRGAEVVGPAGGAADELATRRRAGKSVGLSLVDCPSTSQTEPSRLRCSISGREEPVPSSWMAWTRPTTSMLSGENAVSWPAASIWSAL